MNVLTVADMSLHRLSLLKRRDTLLDEYFDALDKYERWKNNADDMIVCKGKSYKGGEHMIKLLKDNLRNVSRKLRIIDAEITGITQKPQELYSILEIN